jgi:mannose-6-phosphate isomerase-like protein (cupin superfamily)
MPSRGVAVALWMFCALPGPSAGATPAAASTTVPVDTDQVRVTKIDQPPGSRAAARAQPVDRVDVFLTRGSLKLVDEASGKTRIVNVQPGKVVWAPASQADRGENVGRGPLSRYEIELKRRPAHPPTPAFPAKDPTRADPAFYKVELDNEQVRVVRVRIPPRAKVSLHEHVTNRVVVFLTNHHFRVTTPDGQSQESQHAAGDCVTGGPGAHSELNLDDQPFEALLIDLKN